MAEVGSSMPDRILDCKWQMLAITWLTNSTVPPGGLLFCIFQRKRRASRSTLIDDDFRLQAGRRERQAIR